MFDELNATLQELEEAEGEALDATTLDDLGLAVDSVAEMPM